MKKFLFFIVTLFITLTVFSHTIRAEEIIRVEITPIPCSPSRSCPTDLMDIYAKRGESCVQTVADFQRDPRINHYWMEDPEITDQGRANERARQFIYWTINKPAIDNSPILTFVWGVAKNTALFFVVLVSAVMGLGIIVGQRMHFDLKVRVWPAALKIVGMLLYVLFSAAIVLFLIQFSEIIMKFFIEQLGGRDLFNIYFSSNNNLGGGSPPGAGAGAATGWSERNYLDFVGCRDLNVRVQEGAKTEIFLFKLTNITYYVLGSMIIFRKIVLWFMLFVSPFLALLLPFAFIRNIGWIWIGVFFQWLFYGPLLALFLGALSIIWKIGIPYPFDFSRIDKAVGYVYPTAIIITYGGPAQHLTALNNGNYIDTFAEYIITLLMLWAVIIFPWWLLRIFRDYCCDYLMSIKNILLTMYDQQRVPPPSPSHPPAPSKFLPTSGTTIKVGDTITNPVKIRLESLQEIKRSETSHIINSLNVSATKLTDVAHYETNKASYQTAIQNIQNLQNPMKAESSAERQQYMNVRTELFNRAIKDDKVAKHILSSIATSQVDQHTQKSEFVKSIPQITTISNQQTQNISQSISQPMTTDKSMQNNMVQTINNAIPMNTQVRDSVVRTVTENTFTNKTATENMVRSLTEVAKTDNQVKERLVQTISQSTSIDATTRTELATAVSQNKLTDAAVQEKVVKTVAEAATHDKTTKENLTQTISQTASTNSQVRESLVKSITDGVTNDSTTRDKMVKIVTEASTTDETVRQNLIKTVNESTTLDQTTKLNVVKSITEAINSAPSITSTLPVQNLVAQNSNVTTSQATIITKSISNLMVQDSSIANEVSKEMNVPPSVVQHTYSSWAQNIDKQPEKAIDAITKETSLNRNQVMQVVKSVNDKIVNSDTSLSKVATENAVQTTAVKRVAKTQSAMMGIGPTAPAPAVEQSIPMPATVSIEDYEEVKKMWLNQYDKGEIPTTENIKTRKDWVDQDIVFITNVINKLMSPEEKLRLEGLDDVGYILPIFMINNFKGDELLVYLKAKLVAAKEVQEQLEKEEAVKEKLKAREEDLVEVSADNKKDENTKTIEDTQSLAMNENEKDPKQGMNDQVANGETQPPQQPLDNDAPKQ